MKDNNLAETITPNKLVLYTMLLGGTVVSFSNSALNPAIPVFMSTFAVDVVMGSWVLNGYVLAMSIGLMLTGYLKQKLQPKLLYILAIALFSLGSVIGSFAENMDMIIIARAIQGFSAGMIIPVSVGILYQNFPKKQHGRTMALWGIVIMMSLAFGPLVGAYLVDAFAWWTLFVCTIPLAMVVIGMAWHVLPKTTTNTPSDSNTQSDDKAEHTKLLSFDFVGFMSLVTWLLVFMWWVHNLNQNSPLWYVALLVVFIASLATWWHYQLKKTSPLLDLALFRNKVYLHSNIISVSQTIGLMLCLLLMPIVIQDLMNKEATWTGMVLMLSTLVASVTTHFAGKTVDKQGARKIGVIGIVLTAISTLLLAYFLDNNSIFIIIVLMLIRGVGVGFAYLPTTTVGFSSLAADKVTEGAALNNISRRIVSTILIALSMLYIDIRQSQLLNSVKTNTTELVVTTELTNSFTMQSVQEVLLFIAIMLILTIPSALALPRNSNG